MKNFFFLLLVALLSSFHASAQTHFITAGQTQGMIFTDYVPDFGFHATAQNYYDTVPIDLNEDGVYDFVISFQTIYQNSHSSSYSTGIKSLPQNSVYTKMVQLNCNNPSCPDSILSAKKFFYSDLLISSEDTFWRNSYVGFYYSGSFGPEIYNYRDPLAPVNDPYYYLVRIVKASDTLLGYIHLSASGAIIMDYACEGSTSSYIINSINDLPSDKSITAYPNPFTNQINVNYAKPFDYQITDYLGRVFLSGKTQNNILTTDLPSGNYLLMMKNEEMYSVRKIMKNP